LDTLEESCVREGEEASVSVSMKATDAKAIVTAAERGESFRVIEIMKRQTWWPDLSFYVRRNGSRGW
jgi:hypothetical protein